MNTNLNEDLPSCLLFEYLDWTEERKTYYEFYTKSRHSWADTVWPTVQCELSAWSWTGYILHKHQYNAQIWLCRHIDSAKTQMNGKNGKNIVSDSKQKRLWICTFNWRKLQTTVGQLVGQFARWKSASQCCPYFLVSSDPYHWCCCHCGHNEYFHLNSRISIHKTNDALHDSNHHPHPKSEKTGVERDIFLQNVQIINHSFNLLEHLGASALLRCY